MGTVDYRGRTQTKDDNVEIEVLIAVVTKNPVLIAVVTKNPVLIAVVTKNPVFWYIASWYLLPVSCRFLAWFTLEA
jgi:hypothetical protein